MLSLLSHWLSQLKGFFIFDQLSSWVIVLTFITGLSFVFIVPPFQKADEIVHFYKSISVASGQFKCGPKGYVIPTFLHELPEKTRATYILSHPTAIFPLELYSLLWHESTIFKPALEPASCTLPLLYYLPSGLVLFPLVHASAPSLAVFFTGRLVNFLLAFFIALIALKRLPGKYRYLGLIVLALPMTLFQFSSFNKDWATLSVGLLFFAETIRLKFSEKKSIKHLIFLGLLGVLILLSRPTYLPLILLAFLYISFTKVKNLFKNHTLPVLIMLGLGVVIVLGFLYLFALPLWAKFLFLWNQPYVDQVDAKLQLIHIWQHPWQFVLVFWNTLEKDWYFYWNSMIGILGWLDYGLPKFVYTIYYGLFFLIAFKLIPEVRSFSKKEILSFSFAVLTTILLIFLTHYLFSSAVAASQIAGVQGRYFIPILPFGLLALSGIFFYWKKYLAIFLGLTIILTILGVTSHRYYTNDKDYISHFSNAQIIETKNSKKVSLAGETVIKTAVSPGAYLVGLRIYIDTHQSTSLQPYVVKLFDPTCKVETWSKTLAATELIGKSYIDVQIPLSLGTKTPLCWSLSPFEKNLGAKTYLVVPQGKSKDLIATPLYLYRD